MDVDYGGSTGYGAQYRRRLNGQWGIVDVDDCTNAALHLVREGEVDGDRLIVRGGSAGGYTTLASLTFRDVFKVGASYYGISDLEALARETHKFESRYLDSMVGPYPERRDLYVERSPIHHTDRLSCPIILMQGLEDEVVPPNQAEVMVDALRDKGLPVGLPRIRGRAARIPQAGKRRALTGSRDVLLLPHTRLRPSRQDRAGGDREPSLNKRSADMTREKVAILGPNGAGTCLNWHDNRKLPQPTQGLSIVRNPHREVQNSIYLAPLLPRKQKSSTSKCESSRV